MENNAKNIFAIVGFVFVVVVSFGFTQLYTNVNNDAQITSDVDASVTLEEQNTQVFTFEDVPTEATSQASLFTDPISGLQFSYPKGWQAQQLPVATDSATLSRLQIVGIETNEQSNPIQVATIEITVSSTQETELDILANCEEQETITLCEENSIDGIPFRRREYNTTPPQIQLTGVLNNELYVVNVTLLQDSSSTIANVNSLFSSIELP